MIAEYSGDLFSDSAIIDPYPHYVSVRDCGPVVWLSRHDAFALGRFADVRAALLDHETFSSASGIGLNEVCNAALQGTMLASDPPLHDHLRKVVAHRLTPGALRTRKAQIDAVATALVDRLVETGRFDAATDLAQAMPLAVVPDFIGWPEQDRQMLMPWASAAIESLGPMNSERTRGAFGPTREMVEFAFGVATRRELLPGSLGADLIEAADRGEIAPEQCPMLLIDYLGPSIETTASALGHCVALFARYPEQWELLRANPGNVGAAFNEVMRYESPLRMFSRLTIRDTQVDGVDLAAGSRTLILFASANRDERRWERPDEFDITRKAAEQLGFGYGIHGCAGQGLARLECHAVLSALARRVSRIELDGEAVFAVNNMMRVYSSLPVVTIAAS